MPRIGTILVTGGCGYIGVHTVITLLKQGYEVVVTDNFSNSTPDARLRGGPGIQRVEELTSKSCKFEFVDLNDQSQIHRLFANHRIECVIHLASLKSVTESYSDSFNYYKNNVGGLMNLIEVMQQFRCGRLILGSCTSVYAEQPNGQPIKENSGKTTWAHTPVGRTKQIQEHIVFDTANSKPKDWTMIVLRCGSAAGCHVSGRLGFNYNDDGSYCLFPTVAEVASDKLGSVTIYGKGLATKDGTLIRDYIHVMDLARGFAAAVRYLERSTTGSVKVFNITTGVGTSALEVIQSFEKAAGKKIPYVIKPAKYAMVPSIVCDPSLAFKELQWKSEYSIEKMCMHSLKWKQENPDGYPVEISRKVSMKLIDKKAKVPRSISEHTIGSSKQNGR